MKSNATIIPGFGQAFRNWTFRLVILLLPALGHAQAQLGKVVISEVYSGGAVSGSVYKNDFVELYNKTGSVVDLSGCSIQYNQGIGGNSYAVAVLGTISIPANGFLLVQLAAAGGSRSGWCRPAYCRCNKYDKPGHERWPGGPGG